jgi:hypothetical protein
VRVTISLDTYCGYYDIGCIISCVSVAGRSMFQQVFELPKPNPAPVAPDPESGVVIGEEVLRSYKSMLGFQFGGALLLVAVLALALLIPFAFGAGQSLLLVVVLLCGALGAFFSALTRLYRMDELSAAAMPVTPPRLGGWYLLIYSFAPPVVGAIAAVVLYIAFTGELIQGGLFPQIKCKVANQCDTLAQIIENYRPAEPKDYAKALIWAFIAGFSERFVPDTLHNLVGKRNETRK